MATTLSEFYKSKGQALPTVQARTADAAKAGITNYVGTAEQNNKLLSYLSKPAAAPAATPGASNPIVTNPAAPAAKPTNNTPAEKLFNVNSQGFTKPEKTTNEAYDNLVAQSKAISDDKIDPKEILRRKLQTYQSEIDAVNTIYADKLARAKITGEGAIGTNRAMSARSGLLGTDFGIAQDNTVRSANEASYGSIDNEKQGIIQNLMTQARKDAQDEIDKRTEAKKAGPTTYIKNLAEAEQYRKSVVTKRIKALVSNGIDIKTLNPSDISKLAKLWNVPESEITAMYNDEKSALDSAAAEADLAKRKDEATIAKINAEIAAGKWKPIGDGAMLYNSETGKIIENPEDYAPSSGSGGGFPGGKGGGGPFKNDLDLLYNMTRTGKNSMTVKLLDAAYSQARDDADRIKILAQNTSLPSEIKADVIKRATAIPNIDNALTLLDKGVQTGYFKGLVERGFNKFGQTTDPELNRIQQYITAAIQPYRNSVTGAAWGTQEENEYQQLFGSTLDNPEFLKAKLSNLKNLMQSSNVSTISSGLSLLDPSLAGQFTGAGNYSETAQSPGQFTEKVQMRGPNGQTGLVDKTKVESAKQQGWVVTQ